MIALSRETLYDVIDEVGPLLALHYEELCMSKDVAALAPIWDQYAAIEREGAFAHMAVLPHIPNSRKRLTISKN